MEDFADRLQQLKERSGYKFTREFASACGVGDSAMYKYLEGSAKPSYKVLLRFRKVFSDLDYNWLLFGDKRNGL